MPAPVHGAEVIKIHMHFGLKEFSLIGKIDIFISQIVHECATYSNISMHKM